MDKDHPITYNGEREINEFIKFLKEHSTFFKINIF